MKKEEEKTCEEEHDIIYLISESNAYTCEVEWTYQSSKFKSHYSNILDVYKVFEDKEWMRSSSI